MNAHENLKILAQKNVNNTLMDNKRQKIWLKILNGKKLFQKVFGGVKKSFYLCSGIENGSGNSHILIIKQKLKWNRKRK